MYQEKYDKEIREAHMEIGALKERLRLANLKIEAQNHRIAMADEELSDQCELEWCDGCDDYTSTDYETKIKASIDGPEEGNYFCESCGKIRGNQ